MEFTLTGSEYTLLTVSVNHSAVTLGMVPEKQNYNNFYIGKTMQEYKRSS